jgi:hypothetical protein
MGPTALLSLRKKTCCGFLSPLKFIASAGFEPANVVFSGKHANQRITEASKSYAYSIKRYNG